MPRRFSLPVRVCRNWHTQFVLQMSKTKSINFLQLILFALVIICRSTLDVSLEAYPLCGAVQSPYGSAPFTIMAVYLISDGHSIFRSSLNWLHHTPKNRNSRIISMVENSRKNAPFFPIGKPEAHCKFMLKYGKISASGGCL